MLLAITIIASLITIAVTAVLIALFYRISSPAGRRSRDDGGDAGTTFVAADRGNRDSDGRDSGDGDGGGGGK